MTQAEYDKKYAGVKKLLEQGLSQTEAARESGLSPTLICHLARRWKIIPPRQRMKIDWNEVDWSKTSKELALELNCSISHVQKFRMLIFGKKYSKATDWKNVDWNKGNDQIAAEMDLLESTVAAMRGYASPHV